VREYLYAADKGVSDLVPVGYGENEWYLVSATFRLGPYFSREMAERVAAHWSAVSNRRGTEPAADVMLI
jgi:hypothetical protein